MQSLYIQNLTVVRVLLIFREVQYLTFVVFFRIITIPRCGTAAGVGATTLSVVLRGVILRDGP